ncbi:TPA: sigma-70 family RNA polymerase sigma factor [Streptococcus suis]|nr:sigma-70 family RNA polymerase sigma factor [Streptococcus suis]
MIEQSSLQYLSFESLYKRVQPIVHKCRRQYHIQLWDFDDWDQEGMICLFHLVQTKSDSLDNPSFFFACFKTKFSNYLKDVLRSQESDKRRLNRLPYEEISELSHCIAQEGLSLEDRVIMREQLAHLKEVLPESRHHEVDLLLAGNRFKGRRALLRQLKELWD